MRDLRKGLSPPWCVAHRGASASRPENTAAAFDAALAEGCDAIELDVQLSAEGVPFVFHDRTLHRVCGGRRRASGMRLRDLRALDAGSWFHPRFSRERIPTLEEVLERYGGRTHLLVEMKVRPFDKRDGRHLDLARATAKLLQSRDLVRSVAILSFNLEALLCAGRTAPGIRLALNLRPPRRLSPSAKTALPRLWALSIGVRRLTPSHVRAAHEIGKPVLVFACNTERYLNRARDHGADAIMSARPGWLREMLSRVRA